MNEGLALERKGRLWGEDPNRQQHHRGRRRVVFILLGSEYDNYASHVYICLSCSVVREESKCSAETNILIRWR